jgi:hypothetical protein
MTWAKGTFSKTRYVHLRTELYLHGIIHYALSELHGILPSHILARVLVKL